MLLIDKVLKMKKLLIFRTAFLIIAILFIKIDFLKAQNEKDVFPKYGGQFNYQHHIPNLDIYENRLTIGFVNINGSDTLFVFKLDTNSVVDTIGFIIRDSNKVFYTTGNINSQYETLYDYTLNIGDTAYYDSLIQEYATVIDTLSIDFWEGKKLIKLSNGDEWLHGIGSKRHPFRAIAENDINRYNVCHVHVHFESYNYPFGTGYCIGVSSEYEVSSLNFSIYPNPIKNNFSIETADDIYINQIKIYNLSGQEVYSEAISKSQTPINLTLPNLPNGMYVVNIQTEHGVMNKKINVVN
jgi:hypothetical protein